jgi:signal peptidase II
LREAVQRAIGRRERREASTRWWRLGVIALAVLVVDQVAKALVRSELALGERVDLIPGLDLTFTENTGIAFGLFPGRAGLVAVITFLALAGIAVAIFALARRHALVAVGGGLLVGGSLSNMIDRVVHGAVTDYIDVSRWPPFNLADCAIVVGAALIVFGLLRADAGG